MGRIIAAAAFLFFLAQSNAFGFGWGIPLPALPPIPGQVKDDQPVIDVQPPADPDEPIIVIDGPEEPPPGGINETPEPATIVSGLIGAAVLGVIGWRRRRNASCSRC
jgi:hypothetical protein